MYFEKEDDGWYVICEDCCCEIQVCDELDNAENLAIEQWNTRHDEMTIKKTLLLIVNIAVYSVVLSIIAALSWNFYQSFQ